MIDRDRASTSEAGRIGYGGWTGCRVLVGTIDVIGCSKVLPGTGARRGNDAVAMSLAQAGADHLAYL
jgi:hypothetical protein